MRGWECQTVVVNHAANLLFHPGTYGIRNLLNDIQKDGRLVIVVIARHGSVDVSGLGKHGGQQHIISRLPELAGQWRWFSQAPSKMTYCKNAEPRKLTPG